MFTHPNHIADVVSCRTTFGSHFVLRLCHESMCLMLRGAPLHCLPPWECVGGPNPPVSHFMGAAPRPVYRETGLRSPRTLGLPQTYPASADIRTVRQRDAPGIGAAGPSTRTEPRWSQGGP